MLAWPQIGNYQHFLVKYISFDFDQLLNLCLERKAVIRTIVQENIDNIEFKVDVNSTKLPMAIKIPIMIAGFGELLSTPVLSNWLLSGMRFIIYLIIVCCHLKGMRHLCLVYNWRGTWILSSFWSNHLCQELHIR